MFLISLEGLGLGTLYVREMDIKFGTLEVKESLYFGITQHNDKNYYQRVG